MSKKTQPTLKTIAEIAEVSTYTVSRALRGFSDISEATTARIKQIANEIGYIPNAYGNYLSTKKSNILGMIVPTIGSETAYNEVINAVTTAAADHGLCVQLGSCNRDIALEKAYCQMMCQNRVEALIMVPISSEIDHIQQTCNGIVPVIFFGGKVNKDVPYFITNDYTHSAKLAVKHLYELGHREIALFLYAPDNNTIAMKREGYIEAMLSYQLTPNIYMQGHSSDTFLAGYQLIEQLIATNKLPTAIWCASDLMALGAVESLKKHGLSIPKDISIIGHDNLFLTAIPSISLTTFTLPKSEMGNYAVNMALSIIGRTEEPIQYQKTFVAELIKRQSTNIPPNLQQ